uniref:Uncharacterized protein n=1 Tax=Skeletonema marinoi TaxID=267567 RepID=A0A7S2PW95_9STRA|mmetsp:Transcript_32309/g.54557  ORF Transcript_32309/g.54557 Transcript_32309/m.54557 type:complete len:493 (+) Transcript_32309:294-1772(+)
MLATTITDPLLSSPTQVQRHDDDMAVTFPPSLLDHDSQLLDSLTYSSTSCSSEQNDHHHHDDEEEVIIEHPTDDIEELEQEDDDEEEDETPFEQLMNRGNYLRQLRALALQDEMERRASTLFEEEKKEEDNLDSGSDIRNCNDEFGPHHGRFVVSPNVSCVVVSVSSDYLMSCLNDDDEGEEELCDHVYTISTTSAVNNGEKVKVLEYNSYLAHQRYYDDLKHVDITYMDYGVIPHRPSTNNTNEQSALEGEEGSNETDGGRVVIEQRKRLGKGGFCWDAAFVLGEHVIAHEEDWNVDTGRKGGASVLELGAGTGLCGIMVGKATKSQVTITDLPELEELMGDNVRRNFGPSEDNDADDLSKEERSLITHLDGGKAKGTVTSRVLRWGVEEDYFLNNEDKQEEQTYDVIIGADIVASLYDPVALAQTLHALCGPTTKIYISSKSRLDKPHETFDAEMARLFDRVEKKVPPCSRLKNPNVFIIQAEGKRDIAC